MALRRRQQQGMMPRTSTFEEEEQGEEFRKPRYPPPPPAYINEDPGVNNDDPVHSSPPSSSSSSMAAKAIRASSAHQDSSLSSAYAAHTDSRFSNSTSSSQKSKPYEYTSMKNLNEPKHGVWGVLARKAKAILGDDDEGQQSEIPARMRRQVPGIVTTDRYPHQSATVENHQKVEGSTLQKGFNAIASSLNHLGGTIGNAFEEGLTIVEDKTADIIQETRKHIKKKPSSSVARNQASDQMQSHLPYQTQTDQELQLKASRDVAMAMAAKAKLLLRELKTVKADLAFAKERCAQLEEESKILRENHERGNDTDGDDLIRLQLETLLAEKARLAHENSVYARENRFLREIVEYHQLTMQDVVYFDEGTEEVTEVYPVKVTSSSNPYCSIPPTHEGGVDITPQMTQVVPTRPLPSSELSGVPRIFT